MSKEKKLVAGVGIREDGKWKVSDENKKHTWYYKLWINIIHRCYSEAVQKNNPTYIGCSVSDEFKNFQLFAEWVHKQKLTEGIKYHLDKDILVKGNKEYSSERCRFVPMRINQVLTKADAIRGAYPVGVWLDKRRGTFQCNFYVDGKKRSMPSSKTPEEAFYKYKQAKEKEIKRLADIYKNDITPETYKALYEYEVEITD